MVHASATFDVASAQSEIGNPKSKMFRDLIPLSAPGPGEQYAFEVDLDACSGCKACVSACHALNGLDETESWRDVGLLVAADDNPWQQTVTTACHHCSEPACLLGCPVIAYEKDPLTGIVKHLDDQCIGCSYCVLKCPYDVPKFNARLGIVRKCDMCQQRLAVGEAPACAQACPTQAIRIVTVDTGDAVSAGGRRSVAAVSTATGADKAAPSSRPTDPPCGCGGSCGCDSAQIAPGRGAARQSSDPSAPHHPSPIPHHPSSFSSFLPAAPDPAYTRPTTRYVSARGLPPHIRAADASDLRVQPAHWPLVFMLTLTQLGVGLLATAPIFELPVPLTPEGPFTPSVLLDYWSATTPDAPLRSLVTYYVTSAAGPTALVAGLALLFAGLGASVLHLGKPLRAWRFFLGLRTSWLSREILAFSAFAPLAAATLLLPDSFLLRAAVVAGGLAAVFCSAMIYIDTRRRFWAPAATGVRFFGTALVGALALAHPLAGAGVLLAKLLFEGGQLVGPSISARLQRGPLRALTATRFALGLAAILALALGAPTWLVLPLLALGELAERAVFFSATDSPKMPGNPASA